jgi:hypothetical protein
LTYNTTPAIITMPTLRTPTSGPIPLANEWSHQAGGRHQSASPVAHVEPRAWPPVVQTRSIPGIHAHQQTEKMSSFDRRVMSPNGSVYGSHDGPPASSQVATDLGLRAV